jgi:hypothetical protein
MKKRKPIVRTYAKLPPVVLKNPQTDEDIARVANAQKQEAHRIAERLVRGDPLSRIEREFAAVLIKAGADLLGTKRTRGRGRPATMDPGTVAMEYLFLVKDEGLGDTEAVGELANRYDVSEEGVRKTLKKYKRAVLDWHDSATTKPAD